MHVSNLKTMIKEYVPDSILEFRGRALHVLQDLKRIPQFVDDIGTYYPDSERKSKLRILLEYGWWVWTYKELNPDYFLYGLDRKNTTLGEYLSHPTFAEIRDRGNDEAYTGLLRDKFVFAQLATSLGIATPEPIAILDDSRLEWLSPRRTQTSLDALLERDLDAVCKPVCGGQGQGVFGLRTTDEALFIDGKPTPLDSLRERITERYLLQQRIDQHEKLDALHPSSVNTLRLITARTNGDVDLLSSVLRVGAGGACTDNLSRGGMIAYVDPATGTVQSPGVFKYGPRSTFDRHPDTGVPLDGYTIPHFRKALDLARQFHADLHGLRTIGWDVAITPDGPTVLEGNSEYGGSIPQTVDDGFKDRFLALFDEI